MRQLGGIASQLLNLRFNKIGSLFEEAGEYRVGKCLSPAFIFHDRETLGDAILRGPFEHDDNYYQALISVFLLHVQELRLQQKTSLCLFQPRTLPLRQALGEHRLWLVLSAVNRNALHSHAARRSCTVLE